MRAKQDVLGGPWVVATDKAGCLRRNVCFLEQPSTASSVRVGQVWRCMGGWSAWKVPSSGWRGVCRGRES